MRGREMEMTRVTSYFKRTAGLLCLLAVFSACGSDSKDSNDDGMIAGTCEEACKAEAAAGCAAPDCLAECAEEQNGPCGAQASMRPGRRPFSPWPPSVSTRPGFPGTTACW